MLEPTKTVTPLGTNGLFEDWLTPPGEIRCMESDEYPYLNQLSLPDRLRLAAYEARAQGVPAIHLRAILDAAETLERLNRVAVGPSS